ncbi:MAG: cytochrome c peroxidase [Bacteroidota bacterium]|nr:cytochrome c peroxidase [Bacteroidota bacterium]
MLVTCRKDKPIDTGIPSPTPYELEIPKGFPKPVIPAFNPLTVEGIQLGRMLYYDNILSTNGRSCSSCHNSDKSYSIPIFVLQTGERISVPPHINLAWNSDFNWNGSENVLDHEGIADFGPEFFNSNQDSIYARFSRHALYPDLFLKAFGLRNIAKIPYPELQQKIVYAISQFMRTMISSNSKLDQYKNHKATLTAAEMRGAEIYMSEKGDCFHCHGSVLYSSNAFSNNGLDSILVGPSEGRSLITGKIYDRGKFSVPTLRNIELTAPYMHDGRFATLEEVVEFYNSGVKLSSPNIDPLMTKTNKQFGLGLTHQDKSDLVQFLKTLTDTVFMNNKNFQSPF